MRSSIPKRNFHQENKHIVDILFILGLFVIFVLSSLMLVIIGANVYQRTVDDMQHNYESRTAHAYLTEKFRQADHTDAVSLLSYNGQPVIALEETVNGASYTTYLYEEDGYLRELFTSSAADFNPSAGQPITQLSDFQVTAIKDNLYEVLLASPSDDKPVIFYISLKSLQ